MASNSSSTKVVWWAPALLGAVMTLVGCSTATTYQGASPSFRSVSGYPDMKNSYVGMNFNFVVNQPGGYHHPQDPSEPTTSTATASAAD